MMSLKEEVKGWRLDLNWFTVVKDNGVRLMLEEKTSKAEMC